MRCECIAHRNFRAFSVGCPVVAFQACHLDLQEDKLTANPNAARLPGDRQQTTPERSMSEMSWTDERVETLKTMWSEGKSASQIAKELGGVTRNAVIGKVHRLGLSNRAGGEHPEDAIGAEAVVEEEAAD